MDLHLEDTVISSAASLMSVLVEPHSSTSYDDTLYIVPWQLWQCDWIGLRAGLGDLHLNLGTGGKEVEDLTGSSR